jgi:hypothetical protein
MSEIDSIKSKLIDELWLPISVIGSKALCPRIREKRMKMLTLTNDRNFQEIETFMAKKMTEKDCVNAWTDSFLKTFRLETEVGCNVVGHKRYEDFFPANISSLQQHFPFDIVNLDFSSQDPLLQNGRVEKEIKSLEHTVKLQMEKIQSKKGFILIYTTLLNSKKLNKQQIVNNSNAIDAKRWGGSQMDSFEDLIVQQDKKIEFIQVILREILKKYKCPIFKTTMDIKYYPLSNSQKIICSAIKIIARSND